MNFGKDENRFFLITRHIKNKTQNSTLLYIYNLQYIFIYEQTQILLMLLQGFYMIWGFGDVYSKLGLYYFCVSMLRENKRKTARLILHDN